MDAASRAVRRPTKGVRSIAPARVDEVKEIMAIQTLIDILDGLHPLLTDFHGDDTDNSRAVKEVSDILSSTDIGESVRLKTGMEYALNAPDLHACKSVLFDFLHGGNGAENVDEIREKFGSYQEPK
jgi:hypothetical protein